MKVFISWSGTRSRAIADALRSWLPIVLQNVKPWMSSKDIPAGKRWSEEIASELGATSFGILCITPENAEATWIAFEAGALAKATETAHVVPYLVGMDPADIPEGPLNAFQAKRANRAETLELLESMNSALGASGLPSLGPEQLSQIFEAMWPRLEEALSRLPPSIAPAKRNLEDMVKETLDGVRSLARSSSTGNPDVPLDLIADKIDSPGQRRPFRMPESRLRRRLMERAERIIEQESAGNVELSGLAMAIDRPVITFYLKHRAGEVKKVSVAMTMDAAAVDPDLYRSRLGEQVAQFMKEVDETK